jgi:hypothetical protein
MWKSKTLRNTEHTSRKSRERKNQVKQMYMVPAGRLFDALHHACR